MALTFGSLFAGVGGFDLGFGRAGMVCKWQVEINEKRRQLRNLRWPNVRQWDDICTWPQPGSEWVDVLCGGFPVQWTDWRVSEIPFIQPSPNGLAENSSRVSAGLTP